MAVASGIGLTVIVNVVGVPEQVDDDKEEYVIVTRPSPVCTPVVVLPLVTPPV